MKGHTGKKTDEQLIKAIQLGDKGAFASLVRRYEDTVYRFSYKVCRDEAKAEETLQDTFINVYRKLASFDRKSKFSTWLYSIVANNCLMSRRKRKLDDLLESLDDTVTNDGGSLLERGTRWDETPADVLLRKEFQSVLDKAIMRLSVDHRVVFVLRDLEGKSTEETAKILMISEEAAKSRLRRARAFLRTELGAYLNPRSEVNT